MIFLLNNTGILKLIFREPFTEEVAEEDDADEEYAEEEYDEYEEETVVLAAPGHTVKKRR